MMQMYNNPKFIYPPRTEHASNPAAIDQYDDGSFIGQVKYNGDCVVVVMTESHLSVYNREGKLYTKSKQGVITRDLYRGTGVMVLVGEYLSKNKLGEHGEFNHKFVIWDLLVLYSNYLIGQTFEQRLEILDDLYPASRIEIGKDGITEYEGILVTQIPNTYRAASFLGDFSRIYTEVVQTDLYEGLVLKKRHAGLDYGYQAKNNGGWQLKFRSQTKNYTF